MFFIETMSVIFIIVFLALFFLLTIPAIILSLISRILSFFGFGKRRNAGSGGYGYHYHWGGGTQSNSGKKKEKKEKKEARRKLFDKDEGEYVDFEEIK